MYRTRRCSVLPLTAAQSSPNPNAYYATSSSRVNPRFERTWSLISRLRSLLRRRWTCRGLVIVSASVYILWWLHLDILPAAEIAFVLPVVAAVGLRLVVGRWRLLCLLIRVVLSSSMAPRCLSRPICSTPGLNSTTAASTSADTAEEEEHDECAQDDYAQCHPSSPVGPA